MAMTMSKSWSVPQSNKNLPLTKSFNTKSSKLKNLYGNQRVCFTYSCYKTFGEIFNVSYSLIKKVSRFNNIWPTTLVLAFQTVIRYMMYFDEGNLWSLIQEVTLLILIDLQTKLDI
ncbi:unnamed protein product [Blepharisma stoltei]|uniref:Uncharacterized protein n=1 Tax=Blepharisma stoltei TaxID=1481888 RepID=A0AAU9JU93_9CILI|nr:unnamed protein product [Blepharisma stoltei]